MRALAARSLASNSFLTLAQISFCFSKLRKASPMISMSDLRLGMDLGSRPFSLASSRACSLMARTNPSVKSRMASLAVRSSAISLLVADITFFTA